MRIRIIFLYILFTGCSPRYKMTIENSIKGNINANHEILVLDNNSNITIDTNSLIAEIKGPYQKTFTPKKETLKGCGYSEIIRDLKEKSQQLGTNIIDIFELKKPNGISNCYKIKAKLYRNIDDKLVDSIKSYNSSKNISKLDKNANFALIHLYRPKCFYGTIVKFDILMDNNAFITKLSNGQKISFKIFDFGVHTFSGINQKNHKKEISIEAKKGQEYYLRCGVDIGRDYGVPQFSLIDNLTGLSELEKVN